MCVEHFHDAVIKINNKNVKEPVLSALPTLKLAPGLPEARNAIRYVVDPLTRMSLDVTLKRPIETPLEVTPQA